MKYPICPYCDESSSKKECDTCIENFNREIQKEKEHIEEISGKICNKCNKIIIGSYSDVIQRNTTFENGKPLSITTYWHHKCHWSGK